MMNNNILNGKFVRLRDVEVDDAQFILMLRCDEEKAKFLHKTENNIKQQEDYLKNYKKKANEWYFIIENLQGKPIGTYRIYDVNDDSFCIGSWLMISGSSPQEALESDFLLRKFGFEVTNLTKIRFNVHKNNKKVVRFHKCLGAQITGENDEEYYFECTKDDYMKEIIKFL